MTVKMTKSKLTRYGERWRQTLNNPDDCRPSGLPLVIAIKIVPTGLPLPDLNSNYIRYEAFTEDAPNGYLEINAWDIANDAMPIGRSIFFESSDQIMCDSLAIEEPYRGNGLGQRLIDLAERLLGGPVWGAKHYTDDREALWFSVREAKV